MECDGNDGRNGMCGMKRNAWNVWNVWDGGTDAWKTVGLSYVFIVTELACGGDLLALLLSEGEVCCGQAFIYPT